MPSAPISAASFRSAARVFLSLTRNRFARRTASSLYSVGVFVAKTWTESGEIAGPLFASGVVLMWTQPVAAMAPRNTVGARRVVNRFIWEFSARVDAKTLPCMRRTGGKLYFGTLNECQLSNGEVSVSP